MVPSDAGPALAVRWHAARTPDAPAVDDDGRTLTYADLDRRAGRVALALAAGRCAEADRCLVAASDAADTLVALLAVDRLAATAVVADRRWPPSMLRSIAATAGVRVVLSGPLPEADGTPPAPRGGPDSCFLAACTSGSTGTPRTVLRTRRSWSTSFAPFRALTGIGAGTRVLVPGALSASLFLFGAVHALAVGACVVLAPLTTPRPWSVAHLVPAQLADLLSSSAPSGDEAPRLTGCPTGCLPGCLTGRLAVVAGAAVPAPAVARAADAGLDLVAYYGATELSFVAAGRPPGPLHPFPWAEVTVRDGAIWVRSPYLAEGYLGDAGGPYRRDGDGWATVGDLGSLDGRGLRVRGRGDEAVVTGGATVLAEEVEASLADVPGVAAVAVVGVPHPRLGSVVTAVVVPEPAVSPSGLRAALRAQAVRRLTPSHRPRRWYAAPELPRTASGKPDRARLAAALAKDSAGLAPLS